MRFRQHNTQAYKIKERYNNVRARARDCLWKWKRPLGRPRNSWDDNIKIDLT